MCLVWNNVRIKGAYFSCTYARTIAQLVTNKGIGLSRYRARNLMKKLGLLSCQQSKHYYRKAIQEHVAIPNTLNRQLAVTQPDQVWRCDVCLGR